MLLGKDRGPIYSRWDMDRPGNRSPVTDYADHGRSEDEIAFILAHKITPAEVEPGDIPSGGMRARTHDSASLQSFLQLLSPSQTQGSPTDTGGIAGQSRQTSPWTAPRRNTRQTQAQSRAALIGIIIWILFILLSIVMSVLGK